MVVVVVVGVVGVVVVPVVVVVVVVVAVDEPAPPAAGTEGPVPTTVRVAVGVEPPLCVGVPATRALAEGVGTFPPETCDAPVDWLPVPAVLALADPAGVLPAGLGTPVVGVVPKSGAAGLPECAESRDWPTGPAPMLNPATIDNAAAATAPDAMKRFRPKKNLDAVTASGKTGRAAISGSGCPNERDLKTSSKVAWSFTSAHSGFDPPKCSSTTFVC
jgi:hypothetical protein